MFFGMDLFFPLYIKVKKWERSLGIIFYVTSWTFIINFFPWCLKQTNKFFKIIYINIQKNSLLKVCNLEVYRHLRVCMHEHFNLNINPFKFDYEIY